MWFHGTVLDFSLSYFASRRCCLAAVYDFSKPGIMAAGFSAHRFDCRSKFVAKFVAACKWLCCKRVNAIQVVPTLGPGECVIQQGNYIIIHHSPIFLETWACSTILLTFIYSLHDRKNTAETERRCINALLPHLLLPTVKCSQAVNLEQEKLEWNYSFFFLSKIKQSKY